MNAMFDFHCRTWAERIERPFEVKYNAYTQSIEVLEDKHQILDLLRDVKGQWLEAGIPTPRSYVG